MASSRASTRFLTGISLVLGLSVAACSYQGDIDDPLFSYLNGDDIRAACVLGSPARYRLIYNADYDEQLRSYEVTGTPGGGAMLTARVLGASGLVVNRISFADLMGWARWTKSETTLSAEQLGSLDAALERSGAFDPAPAGLRLFSKETYWVSNLCRDGVFSFNAWRYPSQRYYALLFHEVLFSLDETGVAVREPVAVPLGASARASVPRRQQSIDERGNYFNVKVGDNGLTDRVAF